ncbi:MAG: PfkB family carbohydrate kinase, partial [Pseudomonadota bacterium]
MTIHVLGSINIDHVYRVPHAPGPGETLADTGYAMGLGGKGANQALAAAAAGARVRFAGAVGPEGGWARARLAAAGVDVSAVAELEAATGHAVILVEPSGENRIVIHGGANRALEPALLERALAAAAPGDWWLVQNETALVAESLAAARAKGLRTAYAAAPFEAEAVAGVLGDVDLLVLNEGEAAALAAHLGTDGAALAVPGVLVTLGAQGARLTTGPAWSGAPPARAGAPPARRAATPPAPDHAGPAARQSLEVAAFAVTAEDTTGAGDCFLGYALAGFDAGLAAEVALRRAAAAAAIAVTRPGAAEAIPSAAEVDAFL